MAYHELKKSEFERIRPLLKGMEHNLILSAVIEDTTPGRVYVDRPGAPSAAFVCSVEGYYLLGQPDQEAFNDALSHLILGQIFEGRLCGLVRKIYTFTTILLNGRPNWRYCSPDVTP